MIILLTLAVLSSLSPDLGATKGKKLSKTDNPSFVCQINFSLQQGSESQKAKTFPCSGTLISANQILTAAHCFGVAENNIIKTAKPVSVLCPNKEPITGTFLTAYDQQYRAKEAALNEFIASHKEDTELSASDTDKQLELMKLVSTHDLAMIQLPQELTGIIIPTTVSSKDIARIRDLKVEERKCFMAGYSKGTTLTAGEVKIKNKSDLENLGLTLDEAFAIRNDLRYRYVAIPYESTTSYTAPGDSGGPMYCELDGINKVLGIASSMSTPDNFLPWMLWSIPTESAIKKLKSDLK